MDAEKVGKAIAYLRKKVGYTQKELADRLGVSDKAVSKWERGLGLPDTSLIGKLAILLDSDSDSLLAGDIVHHNSGWTGLLILGENKYGINAGTRIYDKPCVYFLLGYFLLLGIRKIVIICSLDNEDIIRKEFGDGECLGIKLSYHKELPKWEYADKESGVMVVSGMSFLYGVDQTRFFQKAMLHKNRITVLSLPRKKVDSPTRIYYDSDKRVIRSEEGDKLHTQYDYYQIPIMFCPSGIVADMMLDKEKAMLSLPQEVMENDVYTVILDRGFVEISLDTWNDVMDAATFVKAVQKACGMQVYCIEEIAWRRGMISYSEFVELGRKKSSTPYGKYILEIADNES